MVLNSISAPTDDDNKQLKQIQELLLPVNDYVIAAEITRAGGERAVELQHKNSFRATGPATCLKSIAHGHMDACAMMIEELLRKISTTESSLQQLNGSQDQIPWTLGSRIYVGFLILFSIVLTGVGMNTLAQNLIKSGSFAHVSPLVPYVFSLVIPAMVISLELQFRQQKFATNLMFAAGMFSAFSWVVVMGVEYTGRSLSIDQLMASLHNETAATSSLFYLLGDPAFVSQILAEVFLSATINIKVHVFCALRSSAHSKLTARLNSLRDNLHFTTLIKYKWEGIFTTIQAQEDAYIQRAASQFYYMRTGGSKPDTESSQMNSEIRDCSVLEQSFKRTNGRSKEA